MNLRERVENNLAIWSLSIAVGGFLAGIAAYRGILEIAQLEVVSRSKLEALEERSEQIEVQPPVSGDLTQGSISEIEADTLQAKSPGGTESGSPPENIRPYDVKFSAQFPPFPWDLDIIRPGMRLSEARSALPKGTLSYGYYSLDIASGPFSGVAYYPLSGGEDPTIDSIMFRFRDERAKLAIIASTLREYGEITHKTEALGSVISWPNVKGYKLVVDDRGYSISLASESK